MARTIHDFENNGNAVIFHYAVPYPESYDKPIGCCIRYAGYYISASVFSKGFRVYSNQENFSKPFPSLREAKQYAIERRYKKTKIL